MPAAPARVPAWPAHRACTRADAPAAATSRRCRCAAPAGWHGPPGTAHGRATAPAAAELAAQAGNYCPLVPPVRRRAASQLGFPVPGLEDLLDAGQERR